MATKKKSTKKKATGKKAAKKVTSKKATKKKATSKKATKKATKKKATKKKVSSKKKTTAKKATKKKATKKVPKVIETVASKEAAKQKENDIEIKLDIHLGTTEDYAAWRQKAAVAFLKASETFDLPKVFKKLDRKIRVNRVLRKLPFVKTFSTSKEKIIMQEALKFVVLQSSYYDDETAEIAKSIKAESDTVRWKAERGFSIDPERLDALLVASQESLSFNNLNFEDNFIKTYKDIYS